MVITHAQVTAARAQLLPPHSIRDVQGCLEAVERLGFVWAFTPGRDLLPALFSALDTHQDGQRWDWMWGWKDQLSAARQAYYGKVVGAKPTFVSQEWLPRFYALTGNTGDLEDDLALLGESVRLNELARKICMYLTENGPTGTRTLISQLTDGSPGMRRSLEKGIEQLDAAMIIVKCGTEGGHSIANVWDLFPRFLPEAADAGAAISTREAAMLLLRQYFVLTPAVTLKTLTGLLPWHEAHQHKAIARLLEAGELEACEVDGKPGLKRVDFLPVSG